MKARMLIFVCLVLTLLLAGACGQVTIAPSEQTNTGSTDEQTEPQRDHKTDGNKTQDAAPADNQPGDTPITRDTDETCPRSKAPPPTIASRQTVTFRVKNELKKSIYIPTQGDECTPFGFNKLKLALGFFLRCEGTSPMHAAPKKLYIIAPGESVDIKWDARALKMYTIPYDCKDWGMKGCFEEPAGVMQPVKAGKYTMTLGVLQSLRQTIAYECYETGNTREFTCDGTRATDPQERMDSYGKRCATPNTVSTTFTLPANGDMKIDISINASNLK